jgi:hypothetical protein
MEKRPYKSDFKKLMIETFIVYHPRQLIVRLGIKRMATGKAICSYVNRK